MNSAAVSWRGIALACLVYCLVRALFVVCAADVFQYGEELEKGAAAKALLDGLAIPWHEKAYHLYEGGGFVVSHLKALLFLVVGENVLAHKLAALITGTLILVSGLVLLGRHFGRSAAAVFALLFTFGPESFQKLSLLSLGIHFEAGLFVLVILDRTLRLAFERRAAHFERRDVIVLGLASGFGFYFDYLLAIYVGLAGLALLAVRRDVVCSKLGLWGVLATAIGLAPLFYVASQVGGDVFDIHGADAMKAGDNFARLGRFLRSMATLGWVDTPRVWVWPVVTLVSALYVLRGARRGPFALLGASLLAWWIAYLSSGFVVDGAPYYFGYMRFAPVVLCMLVFLAAAIGRGLDGELRTRRAATAGLFLLLASGIFATARIVASGTPRTPRANVEFLARTKGYDYFGWAGKVLPRIKGDPPTRLRAVLGFDEPDAELLHSDVADAAARTYSHLPLADMRMLLGQVAEEHLPLATLGLGRCIGRAVGHDMALALVGLAAFPPEEGARFAEALGRDDGSFRLAPDHTLGQIELARASSLGPAYLEGVGWRVFRRWVLWPYGGPRFLMKPAAARSWLAERGADVAPHLLRGFDRAREASTLPR
ncbi:MAG: hypothetical protein GY711_05550 [bacterium]|nr:hypothetical protein [bacterium]